MEVVTGGFFEALWFVFPAFLANVAEDAHLGFNGGADGFVFAPAGELVGFCQGDDEVVNFAGCVPEEVDVGGEVDVGLEDVGVAFGDDFIGLLGGF